MGFIVRGGIGHERLFAIMKELHSATDRAAAIVGSSLVEHCLTEALRAHLHKADKITDELFRTTGAFGAFATKINLGLLTGIYGDGAHKELSILKDIRNKFAHSLDAIDFKTQQIEAWTKNLKFCERYTFDQKVTSPTAQDGKKSIGEWEYWFSVNDRDEALKIQEGAF